MAGGAGRHRVREVGHVQSVDGGKGRVWRAGGTTGLPGALSKAIFHPTAGLAHACTGGTGEAPLPVTHAEVSNMPCCSPNLAATTRQKEDSGGEEGGEESPMI